MPDTPSNCMTETMLVNKDNLMAHLRVENYRVIFYTFNFVYFYHHVLYDNF